MKFHADSINNTIFLSTISKNYKSGMTRLEALYLVAKPFLVPDIAQELNGS